MLVFGLCLIVFGALLGNDVYNKWISSGSAQPK